MGPKGLTHNQLYLIHVVLVIIYVHVHVKEFDKLQTGMRYGHRTCTILQHLLK